jgi:putative hemolysin
VAGLARKTNAAILPVYFYGRNSLFFQVAGMIHPRLRTVFLIREMIKKSRRDTIKMTIGTPISPSKVETFESDEELTAWMRLNTYALKEKKKQAANTGGTVTKSLFQIGHIKKFYNKIRPGRNAMQDLILPIDPEVMAREIEALPEECTLLGGERIAVYGAYAWQLKWTMLEIGRLREKTFREVGEGTGKSVDADEYDQYYLHIFMWDKSAKKIAGAYRVGHSDKIIKSIGAQGLYTTTLFKIQPHLLEKIGPALEMGRSFIASEYQKKRSTLALLWRGIGEYLARNPQYRTLYGPVSISTEYNAISKNLMVQFLSQHKTSPELAKFVKAKTPPKIEFDRNEIDAIISKAKDIERISALISEIEMDNKGIPILLKHYLRLNGELLAFNVDKSFGNCIDGLIMVDMTKTDPKLLKSYMGLENVINYRRSYGLDVSDLERELADSIEQAK